jgi:hypothetical protein
MKTIARLGAVVVAAAAIAGCSSGSSEPPGADLVGSTVTVTSVSSEPSATDSAGGQGGSQASVPAAPVVSRPLSDFLVDQSYDPPGQYPPTPPYYSFATPSGRIQCRVVDGGLPCQTEDDPHTVADSALCGFYPGYEGRAVRFGFFSSGPKQPCATIIQGDGFHSPHTLAYGQSVTAELSSGRTVTCTSAVEGLTCTQMGGTGPRGFFLSVDSFKVF